MPAGSKLSPTRYWVLAGGVVTQMLESTRDLTVSVFSTNFVGSAADAARMVVVPAAIAVIVPSTTLAAPVVLVQIRSLFPASTGLTAAVQVTLSPT